jgi:predicted DNA-binding WGR domain protein
MDNLQNVAFEAHHAEMNHHRRYEITVGRDLLDDWTVSIRYGRTGQGGRVLHYAGQDARKLQSIVKERLRRRLSAPKRIGCRYRLKELNAVSGFDADIWLPGEVMAGFFGK